VVLLIVCGVVCGVWCGVEMALEMGKGGIGREFKAFNCDTPFLPEGLFLVVGIQALFLCLRCLGT
jgi:hypothetical protein